MEVLASIVALRHVREAANEQQRHQGEDHKGDRARHLARGGRLSLSQKAPWQSVPPLSSQHPTARTVGDPTQIRVQKWKERPCVYPVSD